MATNSGHSTRFKEGPVNALAIAFKDNQWIIAEGLTGAAHRQQATRIRRQLEGKGITILPVKASLGLYNVDHVVMETTQHIQWCKDRCIDASDYEQGLVRYYQAARMELFEPKVPKRTISGNNEEEISTPHKISEDL